MTTPLTLHIELPEGARYAVAQQISYDSGLYFVDVRLSTRWPESWKRVGSASTYAEARSMATELNKRIAVLAALTS